MGRPGSRSIAAVKKMWAGHPTGLPTHMKQRPEWCPRIRPGKKKNHFSGNFLGRSHDAVIRVYGDAGNVIEAREHSGDFKVCEARAKQKSRHAVKRDG